MKINLSLIIKILVSFLFLFSAFAKLYPTPIYGITKVFEEGQLIPMGFGENLVPYISRFIIALEIFIAITILQKNYIRTIIIPLSIFLLSVFSIHLVYQIILGSSENCGCFGELIPMTPGEALLKNLITIFVLIILYKRIKISIKKDINLLLIQALVVLLLIFAFIPVYVGPSSNNSNSFVSYVSSENFRLSQEDKILCLFDAGCEHCQETAKQIDSISNLAENFPQVYIIFSDTEKENIPNFFDFVGREFPYQIIPFANYDTDEIDSYMELTFPDYDNPVVIFYNGSKQIRLFDGTGENEFSATELLNLLD